LDRLRSRRQRAFPRSSPPLAFFFHSRAPGSRTADAVIDCADPRAQFCDPASDRSTAQAGNDSHGHDSAVATSQGKEPGQQASLALIEGRHDAVNRCVVLGRFPTGFGDAIRASALVSST